MGYSCHFQNVLGDQIGEHRPHIGENAIPRRGERLRQIVDDGSDVALAVDASKLPKGVDASRRERHLSPDAFRAVFGVGATAFSAWPKWRQALAKRKVGLY